MLNTIYVNHQKEAIYPSGKYFFSPSKDYPEYAYETISEETNYVYDMIRDSFLKVRLDKEHYGKSNWNP